MTLSTSMDKSLLPNQKRSDSLSMFTYCESRITPKSFNYSIVTISANDRLIVHLYKLILSRQLILPKLVSMVRQYAIGQFEEAKAQATTPEQIEELKQQYCPAPSELAQLIQTRDNIVNQLNSIGTRLDGLNFSIGITQDITNALSQLSTIIESVKIGLSAAAKVL